MSALAVARHAMNTRFEVLLHGGNPIVLRAAADEALNEIERLEAQLSLFRPTSEIARVNAHAALEPVRVSPPVFRLLQRARELCAATDGAFDPTVAPLLRAWGFLGGPGRVARADELEAARALVGMLRVELDPKALTVRFPLPGMMLDLGAIGKGYAIDCAADALREAGIENAFIHGGTSSCYAIGTAEDGAPWRVAVNTPGPPDAVPAGPTAALPEALEVVPLRDESLGVSAVETKAFRDGERTYGHVLDPRTGVPVQAARLAAAVLPSATETDALSTALMTLGSGGLTLLRERFPRGRFLVVASGAQDNEWAVHRVGFASPLAGG
ncbi:MAG: FAD:protein FMN transferase [Verrucomicrobia bacterium]|nr:FAD:protein FMN transferase [Verrucomicrobiota bacterium]